MRLASKKNLFYPLARLRHRHLSKKYGIQISHKCKIGYGFYIGHGIGIVINPRTVIGNNVNISHFLSIGSAEGAHAVIGDNVYIAPHVSIVDCVHVGNNSTIGAGAVVVKDVPENATVVGVPAKVISYETPGRYIKHPYEIQ